MRRLFFVLLLLLSPCLPARAAAPPVARPAGAIREALDIRYYPGRDRQTLDVFAPEGAAGQRSPVVLFVHGGTWMAGDKNFFGMYRGVGRCLAKNGVVAVLINYRLSPGVRHPEHAKDVARAFAWTCRHIEEHGGDPRRIVLAGHSAGAHLATLVATDESFLKDPALKLTDRDRAGLRGVVGVCGVYRIPAPEEFRKMAARIVPSLVSRAAPESMAGFLTPVLLKASEKVNPFVLVFGTDRDVRRKASPLSHVHKGLPPFLLLNAERDVPGLTGMTEDFAAALRKAGDRAEVKVIQGCTHRTIVLQLHESDSTAGKTVLDFIRRCTAPDAES
jgi:acetyl esterase/lipase